MATSLDFSGTIPSNCTDAIIVSQSMLHFVHTHGSATSLLLLPEAFYGEKGAVKNQFTVSVLVCVLNVVISK